MAVMLSNADVALISLSSTGSWEARDLDSDYGSFPVGVTGVMLVFVNTDSVNPYAIGAREKDNTNFEEVTSLYAGTRTSCYVKVDGDNCVDIYRGDSSIEVYLVGYFTSDARWLSSPSSDVAPGTTGSFQTVDISAYTEAEDIFAIFEVTGSTISRGWCFRYAGSADDRTESYGQTHAWLIMPIDGSDQVDIEIENASVDIFVVGFIQAGSIRTTGGSDIFGDTTGSFTDFTLPDSGKEIAILEIHSSTYLYDVQANGDTGRAANLYADMFYNGCWPLVAIDGSDIAEYKIENAAIACYCWGYLEGEEEEEEYALPMAMNSYRQMRI